MENLMVVDMEKIINSISGVVSSKIIFGDQEQIEEIHVVSYNNRSPKQISRDIQSLFIAKFDMRIDYKKISVAQINSGDKVEKNYRFSIGAIGYCLIDNMVEIKVILKKGEEEFASTIQGPNSKNNIYRLVVQATLECVHNFLGRRDIFIVEDIEKISLAKQEVITLAITYLSDEQEGLLVGSAVLKKDDYEAVVKATLDAVNRKVLQLVE